MERIRRKFTGGFRPFVIPTSDGIECERGADVRAEIERALRAEDCGEAQPG
jgi:hypothetical protein